MPTRVSRSSSPCIVFPSVSRRFHTHWHAICHSRLPALRVGAPAIGIFFDIFRSSHRFKCSASMREIQHILDQKPVRVQCGDEELIDPLACPRGLSCPQEERDVGPQSRAREASPDMFPASLPQTVRQPPQCSSRSRSLSAYLASTRLPLGMLQELIPPSPRNAMHACQNEPPQSRPRRHIVRRDGSEPSLVRKRSASNRS